MISTAKATIDWPHVIARAREDCDVSLGLIAEHVHRYLIVVAQGRMSPALLAKFGASDIVQISMLEARSAIHEFKGATEAEMLCWLRMIVINTLHDETRRYRDVQAGDVRREVTLNQFAKTVAGRSETPSRVAIRKETDVELARAVSRLPPRLCRVVEARYRDGLDYDQIARELGCSAAAARNLWSRALKQLLVFLEPTG